MSTVELAKCKPSSFSEAVIGPRLKICSAVAVDTKICLNLGKICAKKKKRDMSNGNAHASKETFSCEIFSKLIYVSNPNNEWVRTFFF